MLCKRWRVLLPLMSLLFNTISVHRAAQTMHYPKTRTVDQVDDYHGTKVHDPYRWLEDTNSAETAEWVKAENEVTFDYLRKLPQREPLLARLNKIWNYPRYDIPTKRKRYFYFKNDGLQNQSVLYVQDSIRSKPRVLLDPNALSPDGTVAVSTLSLTDDGSIAAYGLSGRGSDWEEFKVRDVGTRKDLADHLRWIKFSGMSWTNDNRGFFYSRYPTPAEENAYLGVNTDQKLYYHYLGKQQRDDVLIYERPDEPKWFIGGVVTDDGRYVIIGLSESGPKNRVYYIDLKDPVKPDLHSAVVKLVDVFEADYSFVGNDGTVFYFRTDLDAPRGRVIAIDVAHPDRANWKTLIPESDDKLEDVSLIRDTFIATYLHNATNQVLLFDMTGSQVGRVDLPGLGSVNGFNGRRSDTELFYSFTSFIHPTTIFRYDIRNGKSRIFNRPEVDFDSTKYVTKQVWFRSKDGTRVPMFITHRKGIKRNQSLPTLLYGYGGFNVSMRPGFAISMAVWLENGGVYAVPNLRGGGEFGEEWHLAGTLERKQNVFDDFIAAAEYLISEGYTSPDRLAISGGSNGGLLVGAAMCQRPDLFRVALPAVGVMDMLRYHKFTIGAAWKTDYGTSDEPEQFKTLYSYSPLHNLKKGTRYPATLVTTADHDDRVVPGHSFKFAAALQAAQGGDPPTLIRIETSAGHGAGKPTTKIIEETADRFAFVMFNLGMNMTR